MTTIKLYIQRTALLASLVYPIAVPAEEAVKNENKNNRISNAVSNADLTDNAGNNFKFAVEKQLNNDDRLQRSEEQLHRKLEAFNQHQLNRNRQLNENQNIPAEVQSRRNEYIERMQQRREFFNKMNEQRRQEAEERRKMIRQKMHRTSLHPPAPADS